MARHPWCSRSCVVMRSISTSQTAPGPIYPPFFRCAAALRRGGAGASFCVDVKPPASRRDGLALQLHAGSLRRAPFLIDNDEFGVIPAYRVDLFSIAQTLAVAEWAWRSWRWTRHDRAPPCGVLRRLFITCLQICRQTLQFVSFRIETYSH